MNGVLLQEGEGLSFGTFMVFYPVTVLMLLVNCFGDASPRYVHYPRGQVSIIWQLKKITWAFLTLMTRITHIIYRK